jgi:hypothetical protein
MNNFLLFACGFFILMCTCFASITFYLVKRLAHALDKVDFHTQLIHDINSRLKKLEQERNGPLYAETPPMREWVCTKHDVEKF